ncbi:hypothetical protein I308_102045 [Cryptococcus tetragattii IND107]|uniref:Uncharacterized protein n=1 Tax=Cryptococcus tetragattii IND107 TaxID=1296105 RepID=A0ABR3BW91_9TREE
MSDRRKLAAPVGVGAGKPDHPFAVTVEDPVPNAIVPDGYGIKYHAYHTMSIYFPVFFHFFVWSHADMINVINSTEGVFLPAGTALPGGAVLPMSSVADFPMVLPLGTKLPGGVMVPIVMEKVAKPKPPAAKALPGPICNVQ